MGKVKKIRLLLWQKLLMGVGGAMVFLAFGLTFSAMTSMNRASSKIGVKSKEVLAEQTERFLANIVTGQADVIDLQLDQARITAIHGANVIRHLLKTDQLPDAEFFIRLLASAGDHCTTVYFTRPDGRVSFFSQADRDSPPGVVKYSTVAADHFSILLPGVHRSTDLSQWSEIHQNPYSTHYDRVVDALAPVYVKGHLTGYLGVSVSVIRLVSQFNHRQTIRGSYTFIIDDRYGLVSGPPHGTFELALRGTPQSGRGVIDLSQTQNKALGTILNDMVAGNRAIRRININGRSKYMAYRPLGQNNWSLGLAVPVALATVGSEGLVQVIKDEGGQALAGMVLTTLLFLGIALTAVWFITRRLTQPLLEMADAADHIAAGELERHIEVSGADEIGELAHAFNVMTRQLKQHIDSMEKQRIALHKSETRYRALFENSPISLWEQDFSRVKRYLDDLRNKGIHQFEQYFTDNPDKVLHCAKLIRIIDMNDATMSLYAAKNKTELLGGIPKILADNSMDVLKQELVAIAEGRMFEIECDNQTLDGRPLTIVLRSLVPPGYEQSWRKVFVAVNDITERAKAEREKKKLEDKLRQAYKMEAIGTLAGGIAHDFNNILSAILGYTELLDGEPALGEQNRRYTQQVLKAALRAKDLVNQILAFSRQTEQIATPVAVKHVVTETLKLLRASLPSTIEIHQELHSKGVVMADATQIHQVLMNLCTNAGQAMPGGGVLTLRLNDMVLDQGLNTGTAELPPGPYLKLQVEDTGNGMAPETMARIFDPFFTTKGRLQGTGMGLAVVHGIIQSYGGHVNVESAPGRGSIFDVYLPLADEPLARIEQPVQETFPLGDESILFVDDEEALATLGRVMLTRVGYRVTAFTDSLKALEAVKKSADGFNLVITDMTMPHMTGDKLAKAIFEINPKIPIVICSGFSERLHKLNDRKNVRGYLMKPLNLADLANTVRRILDESITSADDIHMTGKVE